jgi:O-antigen ligase
MPASEKTVRVAMCWGKVKESLRASRGHGRAIVVLIPLLGIACIPGEYAGLDGSSLPKELSLVALAFCALLTLSGQDRKYLSAGEWMLVAIIGTSAISATRAINVYLAFRATTITFAAILLILALRRLDPRTRRISLLVMWATGTITALVALGELAHLVPRLSLYSRGPGGLFLHRNSAAQFVALALPSSWWLLSKSRRLVLRCAIAASTISMVCFIVVTRCRGAWVATAAAVLMILCASFWKPGIIALRHRSSGFLWTACIAAGVLMAIPITNRARYKEEHPLTLTAARLLDVKSGSGRGRVLEMRNSIGMWREAAFFGVAPGNWSVLYPQYAPPGDPSLLSGLMSVESLPHSDYVGVATERGLVGVFFCGAAFVMLIVRLCRRSRTHAADAVLVVVTLVAALLMSAVDPILLSAATLGSIAVVAAAATPRSASSEHRNVKTLRPIIAAERLMWMTASLWVVFALAFFGRSVLAVAHYARPAGLQELAMARRLAPWDYRVHMLTARILVYNDRCDDVRLPVLRARALEPFWPAPEQMIEDCAALSLDKPAPSNASGVAPRHTNGWHRESE